MEKIQTSYQDIKNNIRKQLNSIAEGFVSLGYNLKLVRDKELFLEDGYKDIFEFAQLEYNLSKSNASRFMSINDKFSVDGNSPLLIEEYKDYGSSKLAEMLTLNEEELKLISERTTVKELRDIKQRSKEEDTVATSQQTAEGIDFTESKGDFEEEKNDLKKVIIELFRDTARREQLNEIIRLNAENYSQFNLQTEVIAIVNPSEHFVFRKGLLVAAFEPAEKGIKINKFGQATHTCTYYQFYEAIMSIFDRTEADPWSAFYGEPDEVIEEEREEEETTEENVNITESEESTKKENKPQTKVKTIVKETIVEETIPGRQDIEDYPEYLPDDYKKEEHIQIPQNNTSPIVEESKEVVHELKIASMFFEEVKDETKKFELRKKDRDFKVGDTLKLMEYQDGEYTGEELFTTIIYILEDYTGLKEGYCILGLGEIYDN